MKHLYYLIQTERGPEAQDAQEMEFDTAGSVRHAWAQQVACHLAEGATVRLCGAPHAICTFEEDGEVVLELSVFVEGDAQDTTLPEYCPCPACAHR